MRQTRRQAGGHPGGGGGARWRCDTAPTCKRKHRATRQDRNSQTDPPTGGGAPPAGGAAPVGVATPPPTPKTKHTVKPAGGRGTPPAGGAAPVGVATPPPPAKENTERRDRTGTVKQTRRRAGGHRRRGGRRPLALRRRPQHQRQSTQSNPPAAGGHRRRGGGARWRCDTAPTCKRKHKATRQDRNSPNRPADGRGPPPAGGAPALGVATPPPTPQTKHTVKPAGGGGGHRRRGGRRPAAGRHGPNHRTYPPVSIISSAALPTRARGGIPHDAPHSATSMPAVTGTPRTHRRATRRRARTSARDACQREAPPRAGLRATSAAADTRDARRGGRCRRLGARPHPPRAGAGTGAVGDAGGSRPHGGCGAHSDGPPRQRRQRGVDAPPAPALPRRIARARAVRRGHHRPARPRARPVTPVSRQTHRTPAPRSHPRAIPATPPFVVRYHIPKTAAVSAGGRTTKGNGA